MGVAGGVRVNMLRACLEGVCLVGVRVNLVRACSRASIRR